MNQIGFPLVAAFGSMMLIGCERTSTQAPPKTVADEPLAVTTLLVQEERTRFKKEILDATQKQLAEARQTATTGELKLLQKELDALRGTIENLRIAVANATAESKQSANNQAQEIELSRLQAELERLKSELAELRSRHMNQNSQSSRAHADSPTPSHSAREQAIIRALCTNASDSDWTKRCEAAQALGRYPQDDNAIKALIVLLQDPDDVVRWRARQALKIDK